MSPGKRSSAASVNDDYLRVGDVARTLKVSRALITKLLRSGRLPGVKLGTRTWVVSRADLARFLEKLSNSGQSIS